MVRLRVETRLKNGVQIEGEYTDKFGQDRSVTKAWVDGCVHHLDLWAVTVPENRDTYKVEVIHDESNVTSTASGIFSNFRDVGVSFSDGIHITLPGTPNLNIDPSTVVMSFDTMDEAEDYVDSQIEGGLENASISED